MIIENDAFKLMNLLNSKMQSVKIFTFLCNELIGCKKKSSIKKLIPIKSFRKIFYFFLDFIFLGSCQFSAKPFLKNTYFPLFSLVTIRKSPLLLFDYKRENA